jgi:truncated hemoglobin YjbI
MTTSDYWAHVWAAFLGTSLALAVAILATVGAILVERKLRERKERAAQPQCDEANKATDEVEARERDRQASEHADEPIEEGSLRVAVRRSASRHELFDPSPAGAAERRQAQLDAAAVRRGEETQPVAAVRTEIRRTLLCEPPMVEGMTLFSYLKHHAAGGEVPGAPWDSEHNGALAAVTDALYTRVTHDDLVRRVFDSYDLDELRRHFVRALVTLTSKGLDVETADALGRAHAHLKIRPEQFDAVIGHFVQALKQFLQPRVFEVVLVQLRPAVQALRTRIVTAAGAAS